MAADVKASAAAVGTVARPPGLSGLDAVALSAARSRIFSKASRRSPRLRARSVRVSSSWAETSEPYPVDGAVEAPGLRVEGVDETPEQALALVGELGAVGVTECARMWTTCPMVARASSSSQTMWVSVSPGSGRNHRPPIRWL